MSRSGLIMKGKVVLAVVLSALLASGCGGGTDSVSPAEGRSTALAVPVKETGLNSTAQALSVVSITKVSEQRVGRTLFDYVFQLTVRNDGAAKRAVVVDLSSVGPGTQIVDGKSIVGDFAAGETIVSADTIKVRHDRNVPFDPSAFVWSFAQASDPAQVVPGIQLRDWSRQPAFVGEAYETSVRLQFADSRNRIVGLSVTNPTVGGAEVSIDSQGTVQWTPNGNDFRGRGLLSLTVTPEVGSPASFELPVRVLGRRTVFVATIPAGGGTVADPLGRYLISIESNASGGGSPGDLAVEEQFDSSGAFAFSIAVPDGMQPNVKVLRSPNLVPMPEPGASGPLRRGVRPREKLTKVRPDAATQASEPAAPGLQPDIGSLIGALSGDFGQVAYLDLMAITTTSSDRFQYSVFRQSASSQPFAGVYQIDGNCWSASTCVGIKSSDTPSVRRAPVILVHGYTPLGDLGGGDGTWGRFAEALTARGHPVFELRWRSTTRFEEVAGVLVSLGVSVKRLTGTEAVVIGHSFGGVVAHAALMGQGLVYSTSGWNQVVADGLFRRVITLGSPLSGIASEPSSDLGLTVGRDEDDGTIPLCLEVTCYQAGEKLGSRNTDALRSMVVALDPGLAGIGSNEGQTIRNLHQAWQSGKQPAAEITTLVTMRKRPTLDFGSSALLAEGAYKLGDGLISFMGQAVVPEDFALSPFAEPSSFNIVGVPEFGDDWLSRVSRIYGLKPSDSPGVTEPNAIKVKRNGRDYIFAMTVAHTSFQDGVLVGGVPEYFPIVKYDGSAMRTSTQGFGTHPLFALMVDPDYLNVEVTTAAPPPPVVTEALVRGRFVQDGKPVTRAAGATLTVFNRQSGERLVSYYVSPIASDGTWSVSFSSRFTDSFPQGGVVLSDWAVRLDVGDGIDQAVVLRVEPLAAEVDLGTIDLSIVPQSEYVSATGTVRDKSVGTGLQGARIYLLKGEGWPASTLRQVPASATSRAVTSSASGQFSAAGLVPGAYSVLVEKNDYSPLVLASAAVSGTASLELALEAYSDPTDGRLNDTGITAEMCYRAGGDTLVSCTGTEALALNDKQDGMVGRDVTVPDGTDGKLGFSFSLVPKPGGGFYDKTECVKDNVTGLMWEGKTNDGGLRDSSHVYTGLGDGRFGDAGAYVSLVNLQGLCGHNDWRLPDRLELEGIMDYSVPYPGPAIDVVWFPNSVGAWYWSSTPVPFDPVKGWIVDFANGAVRIHFSRYSEFAVRLVR